MPGPSETDNQVIASDTPEGYELGDIPVVSLVGYSNRGKTTLMVKIIREMTARGLAVFAIKHTHHKADVLKETKGKIKDTDRFLEAGAKGSVLVGPEWDKDQGGSDRVTLDSIYRLIGEHAPEIDFVLIEGMKRGPAPKIEVRRKNQNQKAVDDDSPFLIAVAADFCPEVSVPVFDLEDSAGIVDFLLN